MWLRWLFPSTTAIEGLRVKADACGWYSRCVCQRGLVMAVSRPSDRWDQRPIGKFHLGRALHERGDGAFPDRATCFWWGLVGGDRSCAAPWARWGGVRVFASVGGQW